MFRSRRWLILLVAALSGCAGIPQGTLELRDVMGFSVAQVEGDASSLRIQGTSANSGAVISRVDIVTRGDDLVVLPRQVLAHPGLSGNLYLVLKVPPHIHRVLFGEEGREIWPHVPPPPLRAKSREELEYLLSHPQPGKQVELF